MKADIHPTYVEATVRCSCGNTFTTRSTKADLHVELCNECHPFFTGKQKLVDSGGRVERFQRRYGQRTRRRPGPPGADAHPGGPRRVAGPPPVRARVPSWRARSLIRCSSTTVSSGLETEYETVEAALAEPATSLATRRACASSPSGTRSSSRGGRTPGASCVRHVPTVGRPTRCSTDSSGDDRERGPAPRSTSAERSSGRLEERLQELLLPKDPNDGRNVIVEIRGAEGGEEANLFARDLFDMYLRYAALRGWKVEVLSEDASERDGLNEAVFRRQGQGRLEPPRARGRPAPRPAGAGHRVQGAGAHVVGHRHRAARGRGGRRRDRSRRPQDRRLPLDGSRWAVGQHHRLGGADHPPPDRASSWRCRTRRARSRTVPRRWWCCGPACFKAEQDRRAAELAEQRREPGRRRRPLREDPDLQLQGEPGHRPPDRPHAATSWTRCWRATSTS